MKRAGKIATIVFALVAFVAGFGGVSAGLYLTQPASNSHTTVAFVVNSGDTFSDIANHLQSDGLIRNAAVFRLYAKLHRSSTNIQQGTYQLSPSMTMDQIIATLLAGVPIQQVSIAIPPGLRVTQYPALFAQLSSFSASDFMKIATTGKYLDGTTVNSKYWYVEPLQKSAKFALEGYLVPDTYYFESDWDTSQVINRLLDALGEHLCPGPDAVNARAYIYDQAQCKAHAAQINKTSVFTLLEQKYSTKDDAKALYEAITIASIVQREVSRSLPDIQKVTNVYYNRYEVSTGALTPPPGDNVDDVNNLGGDPTAQYARDTDNPPTDGKSWWKPLNGNASQIDPTNPYNTNNGVHKGLPPGPISAPDWAASHVQDAIDPNPSGPTSNFFFWASCKNNVNTIYYADTVANFNAGLATNPPLTC
jgi:UPF0755 protein